MQGRSLGVRPFPMVKCLTLGRELKMGQGESEGEVGFHF